MKIRIAALAAALLAVPAAAVAVEEPVPPAPPPATPAPGEGAPIATAETVATRIRRARDWRACTCCAFSRTASRRSLGAAAFDDSSLDMEPLGTVAGAGMGVTIRGNGRSRC